MFQIFKYLKLCVYLYTVYRVYTVEIMDRVDTMGKRTVEASKSTKTRKGRKSERTLLETVQQYPGLSLYELSQKSKWSIGQVDGTVRRLLNSKEVVIEVVNRNGRRVNLVYPRNRKPSSIVEVPEDLLEVGNPVWREEAFLYALDSTTIGISGREVSEWDEISCFGARTPLGEDEGKVSLTIPDKFVKFYHLDEKHRTVTINGNNILVTVSGDIIERKEYPS